MVVKRIKSDKGSGIGHELNELAKNLVEEGKSFFADLNDIEIKPQIRRRFRTEKIREIAQDIEDSRQLEPALLRRSKTPGFTYELIAGEYRTRSQMLRKEWWIQRGSPQEALEDPIKPIGKLWAVFVDVDDDTARRYQISENRRRVDVDLIDNAYGVLEDYEKKGSLEAVAALWGESEPWVSKNLNIARRLRDEPDGIPLEVMDLLDDNFSKDLNAVYQLLGLTELSPESASAVATAINTAIANQDDSFKVRETINLATREVKQDIKAGGDGKILPSSIASRPVDTERRIEASKETQQLPTSAGESDSKPKSPARLPSSSKSPIHEKAATVTTEVSALRGLFLELKTRGKAMSQFKRLDPDMQAALEARWEGLWQRGLTAANQGPAIAMEMIADGFEMGGFATDKETWFDFRAFMLGALNAPMSLDNIIP